MKVSFKVMFEQPEGATTVDCREYILDAVTTWRGSLRPPDEEDELGDPMWGLDPDTVTVIRMKKRRK